MKNKTAEEYKKEFYEYGTSIGIKITDLQRLKMLCRLEQEKHEEEVKSASQFKPVEVSIPTEKIKIRNLFDKYYDYVRTTDDGEQRGEWKNQFVEEILQYMKLKNK